MPRIEEKGTVRLPGLEGGKNASAIAFWEKRALVVADELAPEGNVVQVYDPEGDQFPTAPRLIVLDEPGHPVAEMDLEGIAVHGSTVYVLGSHSARRKKTDPDKKRTANQRVLMSPAEAQPARDVLLRLELDAGGGARSIDRSSLLPFLDETEPFKSFRAIASKENGVDLEGIAIWRDNLYVGFRGPVLRGNFTPVLRCRFGSPIVNPEVLFLDLGGRGVRDLAHAEGGLLVLAGPVGDGPGSYRLYFWDGKDGTPGRDVAATGAASLQLLGELSPPAGQPARAKPEGLGLAEEGDHHWDIVVVFDGLEDGHATRYRVEKPV